MRRLAPVPLRGSGLSMTICQPILFSDATTYQTYRTAGQRAAVRAALSMPESATLIALLPTGSGKTEVATTLARLARRQTTIIVVPTVSLAYDFERRFRETFRARDDRLDPQRLVFAWTGETDLETRERFRSLLISGQVLLSDLPGVPNRSTSILCA